MVIKSTQNDASSKFTTESLTIDHSSDDTVTASTVPSEFYSHRKSLGLENKVVYFYGGNIGHAQDMLNIVRPNDIKHILRMTNIAAIKIHHFIF